MSLPRAYLEHVAIRVKDIDWHVRFFAEVLGLGIRDQIAGNASAPRQIWIQGGVQLISDPGFEGPEARCAHLGVMVDDLAGVLLRAAAFGAKALPAGPNWLALPDGLNIEMIQANQGSVEAALAIDPRA